MKLASMLLAVALGAMPTAALAHAPKIGEHGGAQTDAGSFHVELVTDQTRIDVYLRDHGDRMVVTTGFSGTAILVVDGKSHRIELLPAGDNRLSGNAPVVLPEKPKGAVLIKSRTGTTAQGKFN